MVVEIDVDLMVVVVVHGGNNFQIVVLVQLPTALILHAHLIDFETDVILSDRKPLNFALD